MAKYTADTSQFITSPRPPPKTPMKPFSLTYVRYPEDDPLGLAMAIASLAPFCMIWTTVGAFMARRELWDVLTLLGILANEVLAQALKRHFKEPRPATCELVDFCDTHGMPSSHAQLAAFVATLTTLHFVRRREEFMVFCRWNKREASGRAGHTDPMTLALVLIAWPMAGLVCASRVYLGYHSVQQVVAGTCVGCVFGAVYHELVCLTATKRFAALDVNDGGFGGWVARTVIGVRMRDSSLVPDPLEVERVALQVNVLDFKEKSF